jgi:hypothetical protein
MQFKCILSYRTSRSKSISNWHTTSSGSDIAAGVANAIAKLRNRQRRALVVTGIYMQLHNGRDQGS